MSARKRNIPRDEYARDRKSEVLHYLRAALNSAERGFWTQCKERTAEALKSAKQWEHAADVWREWPNEKVSDGSEPFAAPPC